MKYAFEDDELDGAPTDKLELSRWLEKKLGRKPRLSEITAVSAQIASRGKKAKPKAPGKQAKAAPGPNEITKDIVGSAEAKLGFQLVLVGMSILTDIAQSLRASLVPQAAANKASYNLDEQHAQVRELRRAKMAELYGDADYPRALKALVRTQGKASMPVHGRSPIEIVNKCRPDVAELIQTLDHDDWSTKGSRITTATDQAGIAALIPAPPAAAAANLVHDETPSPAPAVRIRKKGGDHE